MPDSSVPLLDAPLLEDAPRYARVAARMRDQMQSGHFKPGDRLPSFPEMKSRHGVSQTTLDKAHSILEAEGLIVRERRRGVFVASPQVKAATGVLGVLSRSLVEDSHFSYWSQLLRGIRVAARDAQYQILLVNHLQDWCDFERVDGILLEGIQHDSLARWPAHLPRVEMLAGQPDAISVVGDEYQGGRLATEHLLQLGHRRIGFLKCGDQQTARRIAGYRAALKSAGIEPQANWLHLIETDAEIDYALIKEPFQTMGAQSMKRWLAENWNAARCSALLVQNDLVAIGAIGALSDAGMEVPRDISVVGFDNTEAGGYFSPALSTVEAPLQAIGARAVELLLMQIEGREAVSEVFPTQLIARASSAALARS